MHTIRLWVICIVAAANLVAGEPHGPRSGQPGPWDNDVGLFRVASDGSNTQLATFERSGVPSLVRLNDGRLAAAHQWFPENDATHFDKVAVRFSSDDGKTWTPPRAIELTGFPENMRSPFDPTLVPLADGRIRLYFTSRKEGGFSVPAIYSAISTDAQAFVFEPGMRFGVEGCPVIDCAVAIHKGVVHLFAPHNGRLRPASRTGEPQAPEDEAKPGVGYHATSADGLTFTRAADVTRGSHGRWLGCATASKAGTDDAILTFYGTDDQPGGGRIWVAESRDGIKWELKKSLDVPGADPGVATATDHALLVLVTGKPRAGTPSANRVRPPRRPPGAFGE